MKERRLMMELQNIAKKKFDEIDYAKAVGILLVVSGHSIPDVSSSSGIYVLALKVMHDIIYTFHMPVMFFISGFLSIKILEYGNRKASSGISSNRYIYERFLRLLVPYFAVGILYMPLKLLLARFANSPYEMRTAWQIFFGENPDGGLWYLYDLFLIQALMSVILTKKNLKYVLISSMAVSLAVLLSGISFFRIDDAIYYFSFSCLGLYVRTKYLRIIETMRKRWIFVTGIFAFAIFEWFYFMSRISLLKYVCALLGIAVVIGIALILSGRYKKTLLLLSDYSMDIYILHGMVMVAVRILFWSMLKADYYVCCLIMFVCGLVLPVIVSKLIIRRVSIFCKLFLGIKD